MVRAFWRKHKRPLGLLIVLLALGLCAIELTRQASVRRVHRHIDAGIEYVRLRRPGDAEREWLAAIKLDPNNAALWELLSTLYIHTEQWNKGSEALRQLLRVAPTRPYIYSRLAACALRSGNELEAQRLAREELKRNPGDEASLTILAFLSNMQDNTEEQIGYLQRLLERSPNNPETLHALAQAYREAGKYPQVLPIVDRLIAVSPTDPYAYAMRGAARYETDASPAGTAQAEGDLLKALASEPDFAFARFNLGRVYLRQREYDKAITQLEIAEQLYPGKMDVPFELATAYSRTGQTEKAKLARQRFATLRQEATLVSVLQKRCVLEKNNFDAYLQMGRLMLRNENFRQAFYYLQHALVLKPDNSAAKEAYQQLAAQIGRQNAPASH